MANQQTTFVGDIIIEGRLTVADDVDSPNTRTLVAAVGRTQVQTQQASANIISAAADASDDGVITPAEKKILKREWEQIASEYSNVLDQAEVRGFEVGDTEYDAYIVAYAALNNLLNVGESSIFADMAANSTVIGSEFRAIWSSYYGTRQVLMRVIETATTEVIDTAVTVGTNTGGGTTTPTTPTLYGKAIFRTAHLWWNKQANLTGSITHQVYRCDTETGTYALQATVGGYEFSDTELPLAGTEADPEPRVYFYKVRRVVNGNEAEASDLSTAVSLTATPVGVGDLSVNSVTANKIDVDELSAVSVDMGTLRTGRIFTAGETDENIAAGTPQFSFLDFISAMFRFGTSLKGFSYDGTTDIATFLNTPVVFSEGGVSASINYVASVDQLRVSKLATIVNYQADWILGSWGSPTTKISSACTDQILELLPDGSTRCLYIDRTTYYLYEVMISSAGVWGSPVLKVSSICINPVLELLLDGSTRCLYDNSGWKEVIISSAGVWGSPVNRSDYMYATSTSKIALTLLADGTSRLIFEYFVYPGHAAEVIISSAGVWGSQTDKGAYSASNFWAAVLSDGSTRVVFTYVDDLYEFIISSAGVWGSSVKVLDNISPWYNIVDVSLELLPDDTMRCTFIGFASPNGHLFEVMISAAGVWGSPEFKVDHQCYTVSTSMILGGASRIVYSSDAHYLKEIITTDHDGLFPSGNIYTETGSGIIESGNNENGSYIKFGDGTMVQYGRWLGSTGTYGTVANWFGTTSGTTYYRAKSITFPEAFIGDLPIVTPGSEVIATHESVSLTGFIGVIYYGASDPTPYHHNWRAEGRWK